VSEEGFRAQERADAHGVEGDELGVVSQLFRKASGLRQRHFTRPVTTFTSKSGEKFKASADQVDIVVEDAANVKVWLRTHEREIAMTIGGLLLAGSAIYLQKNRSQRQKMSKRASSYNRSPRK
jgi:hypothetical protein